jgi:hypothetical protein
MQEVVQLVGSEPTFADEMAVSQSAGKYFLMVFFF